jgi:hypothetical protein
MGHVSRGMDVERRELTWEELADTGERLGGAGIHKCTGSREDKMGRKRHIYYESQVLAVSQ